MAAPVAKIGVQLSATTGQFEKNIEKATAKTKSFGRTVQRATGRLPNFGQMLGSVSVKALAVAGSIVTAGAAIIGAVVAVRVATAAFARLKAGIVESVNALDDVIKTSRKLGLTTGALIGLRLAANRAGIENTKLEMGLQRMTRRISEAAKGFGEAQGALKELRLDAKQLNILSPDQQFQEIAKAMAGVSLQSDKIRLSMKLFDSEGVDLVLLLSNITSLQRGIFDTKRFGLIITEEQAASIENAKDRLEDLKILRDGIFTQLAVKAAPLISGAIDTLLNVIHGANSIPSLVGKVLTQVRAITVDALNAAHGMVSVANIILKTISSGIGALTNSLASFKGILHTLFISGIPEAILKSWGALWHDLAALVQNSMASIVETVISGLGKIADIFPGTTMLPDLFGTSASAFPIAMRQRAAESTAMAASGRAQAAAILAKGISGPIAGATGTALAKVAPTIGRELFSHVFRGGWGDRFNKALDSLVGNIPPRQPNPESIGTPFDAGNFTQGKLQFTALPGVNAPGMDRAHNDRQQQLQEARRANQYLGEIAVNTRGAQVAVAG